MSFLERTGVQVMLALIAVSVYLAIRFKPAREPLTPDGPHASVRIAPQAIFLGAIIACVAYVIYESSQRTFLARVFPMSAALISLALLCVMAVAFARTGKRPSYLFQDSEREWQDHEKPAHSELHFQAWMLGLLGATALAGFVLGVFAFITAFLRLKAGLAWHRAALAASGAIAVLAVLSHVFVLDYPAGLLQRLFELPWPLN